MNSEDEVPRLPTYQAPAIQKPGIMAKIMTKMMKLPARHMPKHNTRHTTRVTKPVKRKKQQFY